MIEKSLTLECAGAELPATVTLPESRCRGAIALLHPSHLPSRDQFLFRHLARLLPPLGVAVMRYDRRPAGDADVPLRRQVDDLSVALRALAHETGSVPTGLWGFSQGAWVSLRAAAADRTTAFLILVGCSGVSPARQMRYGTEGQLRRAGYGSGAVADLAELRTAWEAYQRGAVTRDEAQRVVDRFAERPWFQLGWVPAQLPQAAGWADMDFDLADVMRKVRCPVLAFYGEDEWVPVEESVELWRDAYGDPDRLTIRHLPGTEHHPTLNRGRTVSSISTDYTATLVAWVDGVLGPGGTPQSPTAR